MSAASVYVQEWFTAAELADLKLPGLQTTKRGMQLQIDREGWRQRLDEDGRPLARPRQARGGGTEYFVTLLPEAARAKLIARAEQKPAAERLDRQNAWLRWELLPNSYKAEATRRLEIIDRVEGLMRAGMRKAAAIEEIVRQAQREANREGGKAGVSCSTIFGWYQRIAGVQIQDRCVYLAPDYQGRQKTVECSPEAYEHYKGYYLTQSRPPHSAAYRDTCRVAMTEGWQVPSARTLQRMLEAEITPPVMAYLRHGEAALDESFPHRTRDRSNLIPMQIWNLDGHTWDNEVLWPDGTVKRPVSLAIQDIASGKFVAIRFDLTLNHHLVRLALGDAFRQYGLCETLLMDNGRENTAAAISGGQKRRRTTKAPEDETAGLLKLLGIKATFASPYLGRAKPIERGFRNFAHDISKRPEFVGSYTGHNPMARPENSGSRAVPLAEFEAIIRREIAFYNAQTGRRGMGMRNRSFDEVFAEGVALNPPRRATDEQLRLCMLASRPVTMDPKTGAVTVDGHRYWSTLLGDTKRQRVIIRFDPDQMAAPAYVYDLEGRLLAEAPRVAAGNFDNQQDGREARKDIRDMRRAAKELAKAQRRLSHREVAARSAQADAPASAPVAVGNVVKPDFRAPRRVDQVGLASAPSTEFEDAFDRSAAALMGLG